MKALVTGATGFVGSALVRRLVADGWDVRAPVRTLPGSPVAGCEYVPGYDLAATALPAGWLSGREVVVHAAARVHVMDERPTEAERAHRAANAAATQVLAQAAAGAGVRRFVLLSTAKVHGESTRPGQAFRESDPPAPADPYSRSKLQAEDALRNACAQAGMEYTIIRPPLVYGPGVGANFRALARIAGRGWPLPFGAVHNRRSLVALANLVDLVRVCMTHPAAANQVFLAADGEDVGTAELIRILASAAGRPARLVPVPAALLRLALTLAGRAGVADRLLGNLQVDASKARTLLGWRPPLRPSEALPLAIQEHP